MDATWSAAPARKLGDISDWSDLRCVVCVGVARRFPTRALGDHGHRHACGALGQKPRIRKQGAHVRDPERIVIAQPIHGVGEVA